jgi:hypothetical protein
MNHWPAPLIEKILWSLRGMPYRALELSEASRSQSPSAARTKAMRSACACKV